MTSRSGSPAASRSDAGRWVAIQRNRTSGAGRQYAAVAALIAELRRLGISARLFSHRGHLDDAVQRRAESLVGLVAAGGDGTVLDVINRHPGIPVAILPLGTENLVARHFGIPPRNGKLVARMIAEGHTRAFDLGGAGERRFTVMASCGFDADVIQRAHASRRGCITRRHYHRPIFDSLRAYPFAEIRAWLDDAEAPQVGRMIVVANLPRYALGLPIAPGAVDDDGLLDVRVFSHRSAFQLLRDFGNVTLRLQDWLGAAPSFRARRVRIESDTPLPVQADGDPVGATPIELTVHPRAATVFVPA